MYNCNFDSDGVRQNDKGIDLRSTLTRSDQSAGMTNHGFPSSRQDGQAAIIYVQGPSRDMGLTAVQARALALRLLEAANEQEAYESQERRSKFLSEVMDLAEQRGVVIDSIKVF